MEDILLLIIICQMFMKHAVNCERGYSLMNHIKTKKKASMTTFILSLLMYIKLNEPYSLEEFDEIYPIAYKIWKSKRNRQELKHFDMISHIIKTSFRRKNNTELRSFYDLFDDLKINETNERFFDLNLKRRMNLLVYELAIL